MNIFQLALKKIYSLKSIYPSLAVPSNDAFQIVLQRFAGSMQLIGGLTTIPVVALSAYSAMCKYLPNGLSYLGLTISILFGLGAAYILDGQILGLFLKTGQYVLALFYKKEARTKPIIWVATMVLSLVSLVAIYLSVDLTSARTGVFLADAVIQDKGYKSAFESDAVKSTDKLFNKVSNRVVEAENEIQLNRTALSVLSEKIVAERRKADCDYSLLLRLKAQHADLKVLNAFLVKQLNEALKAQSSVSRKLEQVTNTSYILDSLNTSSGFLSIEKKRIIADSSNLLGRYVTYGLLLIVILALLLNPVKALNGMYIPNITHPPKSTDPMFEYKGERLSRSAVESRLKTYMQRDKESPTDATRDGVRFWSEALNSLTKP